MIIDKIIEKLKDFSIYFYAQNGIFADSDLVDFAEYVAEHIENNIKNYQEINKYEFLTLINSLNSKYEKQFSESDLNVLVEIVFA